MNIKMNNFYCFENIKYANMSKFKNDRENLYYYLLLQYLRQQVVAKNNIASHAVFHMYILKSFYDTKSKIKLIRSLLA